jgi:hypothetical protein
MHIGHVGKVRVFEFFGEIFAYRLVPEKIVVVPDRASNILSNAHLFIKKLSYQTTKKFKKVLLKHGFSQVNHARS